MYIIGTKTFDWSGKLWLSHTSQKDVVGVPGWWKEKVSGKFLFFSPNFVWLTIALIDYFLFPYDFKAGKSFQSFDWILYRFVVNFVLVFGYFGFWHCVLYVFGWSERPFHANRNYRLSKVGANQIWWTLDLFSWCHKVQIVSAAFSNK